MHNMMNLKSSASPAGLYGISSASDVYRCVSTARQSRWLAQSEIQESELWRKEVVARRREVRSEKFRRLMCFR